jgi:hypothetical protein
MQMDGLANRSKNPATHLILHPPPFLPDFPFVSDRPFRAGSAAPLAWTMRRALSRLTTTTHRLGSLRLVRPGRAHTTHTRSLRSPYLPSRSLKHRRSGNKKATNLATPKLESIGVSFTVWAPHLSSFSRTLSIACQSSRPAGQHIPRAKPSQDPCRGFPSGRAAAEGEEPNTFPLAVEV